MITAVQRTKEIRHALAVVITRGSKSISVAVYDSASKYVSYVKGGHGDVFLLEKFLLDHRHVSLYELIREETNEPKGDIGFIKYFLTGERKDNI